MRLAAMHIATAAVEGLYLHVPFCRRRCAYCDFYSTTRDAAAAARFVDAAIAELRFWAGRIDLTAVRTLFAGGGTPTALPADDLLRLLAAAREHAGAIEEFTVEANPATIDAPLAARLRHAGVDRLSLGAQSFNPAHLRMLGRAHHPEQIGQSVAAARSAGFENLSLDLIFGLPGQRLADWRADLTAAIELAPRHLSCYGLTIEPGTPLARRVDAGELSAIDEQTAVEMYAAACDDLAAAGFEHYEISNWARPGCACRHNQLYWDNRSWLGVGPGAASAVAGWRFKTPPDLDRYLAEPPDQRRFDDAERLTGSAAAGEAAMLALRTRRGIEPAEFAARNGLDIRQLPGDPIGRHLEAGRIVCDRGRWRLADHAWIVADSVLADFVAAAEPAPADAPVAMEGSR